MIKVKVTSIYEKSKKLFCKIIDNEAVFEDIPLLTFFGFLRKPKKDKVHFAYLKKSEGKFHVLGVEQDDVPSLEEDEVAVYRDKNNYFKLDKDDGVELKTPNGEAVISKDQFLVKKDNATIEMKDGGMAFKKGATVIELKSDGTIAMKNGATSLLEQLEKVYDSMNGMVIVDSFNKSCTITPLGVAQKIELKTLLSK